MINYLVMKLLRKSEAKKNLFKRRYKTRFLMNWATVENLSNVIYVFSNDVNCDEGFS